MSRRAEIRMTDAELADFLAEQRTIVLGTTGPAGRPHLAPLWYIPDRARLLTWTYARSQKARNLERDPRATVLVEAGERYEELRGAMLHCDVALERDVAEVTEIGLALMRRYAPARAEPTAEAHDLVAAQAPKRVGLVCVPTRVATWDHRKLGG